MNVELSTTGSNNDMREPNHDMHGSSSRSPSIARGKLLPKQLFVERVSRGSTVDNCNMGE